MTLDREQRDLIAGLLRMAGHDDLADEFARRERGEQTHWTNLKDGETCMVLMKVRHQTRPTFPIDEDSE